MFIRCKHRIEWRRAQELLESQLFAGDVIMESLLTLECTSPDSDSLEDTAIPVTW